MICFHARLLAVTLLPIGCEHSQESAASFISASGLRCNCRFYRREMRGPMLVMMGSSFTSPDEIIFRLANLSDFESAFLEDTR